MFYCTKHLQSENRLYLRNYRVLHVCAVSLSDLVSRIEPRIFQASCHRAQVSGCQLLRFWRALFRPPLLPSQRRTLLRSAAFAVALLSCMHASDTAAAGAIFLRIHVYKLSGDRQVSCHASSIASHRLRPLCCGRLHSPRPARQGCALFPSIQDVGACHTLWPRGSPQHGAAQPPSLTFLEGHPHGARGAYARKDLRQPEEIGKSRQAACSQCELSRTGSSTPFDR